MHELEASVVLLQFELCFDSLVLLVSIHVSLGLLGGT